MPGEIESVIADTSSDTGDSNSNPDTGGDSGVDSAGSNTGNGSDSAEFAGRSENPIPHYRHKEMLDRALAGERKQWESKLAAIEKKYEGMSGYKDFAEKQLESTIRALGWKEEEKPELVDKKALQAELNNLKQEWQYQQEEAKLSSQISAAKEKYPKYFEFPGFLEGCISQWSSNKGKTMPQIIEENVNAYKKHLDSLKQEYAKTKEEAAKTQVVKAGGGTGAGAPKPGTKAPRRGDPGRADYLRKKIAALKG